MKTIKYSILLLFFIAIAACEVDSNCGSVNVDYITFNSDAHLGEQPFYSEVTELSNFTGSNGTLITSMKVFYTASSH